MSCKFWGKAFNRGFNLRRHENEHCPLMDQEREMSETETEAMDSGDDTSTSSTDGSEGPMITDSETETEEEENDAWMPMVEQAMQKHKTAFEEMKMNLIHNGLDKRSAGEIAYSSILPKPQKELENIYIEHLLWMKQLKNDPMHKKIMQTRDAFVDSDDFDPEEAMEAAVDKRNFLPKDF